MEALQRYELLGMGFALLMCQTSENLLLAVQHLEQNVAQTSQIFQASGIRCVRTNTETYSH